jgi:hypothetical protein
MTTIHDLPKDIFHKIFSKLSVKDTKQTTKVLRGNSPNYQQILKNKDMDPQLILTMFEFMEMLYPNIIPMLILYHKISLKKKIKESDLASLEENIDKFTNGDPRMGNIANYLIIKISIVFLNDDSIKFKNRISKMIDTDTVNESIQDHEQVIDQYDIIYRNYFEEQKINQCFSEKYINNFNQDYDEMIRLYEERIELLQQRESDLKTIVGHRESYSDSDGGAGRLRKRPDGSKKRKI